MRNKASIDIGLAVLSVLIKPGHRISTYTIADWCDCSSTCIELIEQRALKKMRLRLRVALGLTQQEFCELSASDV